MCVVQGPVDEITLVKAVPGKSATLPCSSPVNVSWSIKSSRGLTNIAIDGLVGAEYSKKFFLGSLIDEWQNLTIFTVTTEDASVFYVCIVNTADGKLAYYYVHLIFDSG